MTALGVARAVAVAGLACSVVGVAACGREATADTDGRASVAASAPDSAEPSASDSAPDSGEVVTIEATVERYVRLGGAGGDLAAARALVDPACRGEPVWDVDAARLVGVRLAVATVAVEVRARGADAAEVAVTVAGSAKAQHTRAETEVLGQKVTVEVGDLDLGAASLTTTLALVRRGDRWLVGCPPR